MGILTPYSLLVLRQAIRMLGVNGMSSARQQISKEEMPIRVFSFEY
jgi:hypothetical protein